MIKLSNMKWIAAAIVTGMLTVTATSCSDDEPSLHDKQVDLWERGNDLTAAEIYGSVKTMTVSDHYSPTWENNAVKEGNIGNQNIYEYNRDGYLTQRTQKSNYNISGEQKLLASDERTYTRDNKHRVVESVQLYYSYDASGVQSVSWGSKELVTYDDNAKTATVIYSGTNDGVAYTENSKRVYQLNQYGRIDESNYQQYPVKTAFEDEPNTIVIAEYDNMGNRTLRYNKGISGTTISIWSYTKTTYVYY